MLLWADETFCKIFIDTVRFSVKKVFGVSNPLFGSLKIISGDKILVELFWQAFLTGLTSIAKDPTVYWPWKDKRKQTHLFQFRVRFRDVVIPLRQRHACQSDHLRKVNNI